MMEEMNEAGFSMDSKYRVAFDLMLAIAEEDGKQFGKPDPRAYYLRLYQQCFKVVCGGSAEEASQSS
jgi:hypothetical protein